MKKLMLRVLVYFMIFLPSINFAYIWIANYDGPNNRGDEACAIAIDDSGNVYITGESWSPTTYEDYATVKYNSNGEEQWATRYNGADSSYDEASAIAIDDNGNVYVTGSSYSSSTSEDYLTVKYNSNGVEQWVAKYNGTGNDYDKAFAIVVDGSGNVYVTGESWDSSTYYDYITIKYDTDGAQQWIAKYNGAYSSTDKACAMTIDGSGNIYVTGYSYSASTRDDYVTVKYNTDGVEQWVAKYNGPADNWDKATAITVDGSGNVYVTGGSLGSGSDWDYATLKYNSVGIEQWSMRYNGTGNGYDKASAIVVDGSGNVYVTGESYGSGTYYDYATLKYDADGAGQWVSRYNGLANDDDAAAAIAIDGSSNVYVTGYSHSLSALEDYATVKYDVNGDEQWALRHNGDSNLSDIASAIVVDESSNVYVTGGSQCSGSSTDYVTIKYSTVGVEEELNVRNQDVKLFQNRPNPFTKSTVIAYQVPSNTQKFATISLKVYDLMGRLVKTLVSENKEAGSYTVEWNGTDKSGNRVAYGIYFYSLEVDNFKTTKKFTILN